MKLADLAKGSTVLLGVIVAGVVSTSYVDQRFATQLKAASEPAPASSPPPTSPPASTDVPAPTNTPAASACIGEDGRWKNWPWPNVPMGSPKCK
ncbi:hypothetical protein [Bradyrhizobium sp.]|jgi:hypothetical protein|uniref:hypothetical protein n=1 Tax=Bradyrhizobium sp. TaxID=376 RepID=UPI002DDD1F2B|nr:hypothetical protein [Bradyrhizobium sp.]HEV2156911.1 hypothetical protein [Bradyrhizobium sp.]